jgi:hypothetical protein
MFIVAIDNQGNVKELHDQDYIHNGKKLINPLDSLVKTLQLGGDMAIHEHIGLIYQNFTFDEHGVKLEDVQQFDGQNWESVQRMCQVKVRSCLKHWGWLLCERGAWSGERGAGSRDFLF